MELQHSPHNEAGGPVLLDRGNHAWEDIVQAWEFRKHDAEAERSDVHDLFFVNGE